MARYIDADDLYKETEKKIKEANSYRMAVVDSEFLDLINDTETADVAPKSEVVKTLNEVELLIIITKETYKQQMEDAPNELSKQSKRTKWIAFEKFYEQFAELKKKYTEGK